MSLHAANMVVLFGYKIGIWVSVPWRLCIQLCLLLPAVERGQEHPHQPVPWLLSQMQDSWARRQFDLGQLCREEGEGVEHMFCMPFSSLVLVLSNWLPSKDKLTLFVSTGGSMRILPYWISFSLPSFSEKRSYHEWRQRRDNCETAPWGMNSYTKGCVSWCRGTWTKVRAHRLSVAQWRDS